MEGKQIYVAIDGTDDARGTLEQPFASLHRAITEIRQIHQSQPKTGVTIIIGNGIYPIRQPLTLAAEVSGTAERPIRFVAQSPGEVRLIGGEIVTNFEPVTDPQVLDRLDPTVHGKVVQADLAALGITDFGSVNEGGLELFFNQQPMPISRWPNEGFVKIADLVGGDPVDVRGTKGDRIGKFYYHGDRPRRWQQEKEAWLHGYWFWDWSDQRHAVESIDINNRIISVRGHPITATAIVKGSGFTPSTCCQRSIDPVSGTWIVKAVYYIFTRLWRKVRRLFR